MMLRQVVLDTETTGLDPAEGHRIIEIGCVELLDRRITASRFHRYLRPDREIEAGALEVHGIDAEFLADKPSFAEIVDPLLEFLRGAEVLIHNAPFDVGFIDWELARLHPARGRLEDHCRITDTLALARERHPGQRNSLEALCRRYGVDDSRRELHGALLDAELLAEVYLAMTGGQTSLELEAAWAASDAGRERPRPPRPAGALRVIRPSEAELAAHRRYLDSLERESGGRCLWRELE